MATIGNVTCSLVKGGVRNKKLRTEVWQTPGVDGYGAMLLGLGDSQFAFIAVVYAAYPLDIIAWVQSIEALQGQVITVVDDWDVVYEQLLVTQVGMPKRSPAYGTADGINYEVRGEIQIQGIVL
jgi:hypothetical protein